jgi:hypothetical protein
MLRVTTSGDQDKTSNALKKLLGGRLYSDLESYGEQGVAALSSATPEDTGLTAQSWHYRIVRAPRYVAIEWYNTNKTASGVSVAVLVQYGHGTGTGGYVQGRDFINPAIRPLFDKISDEVWKKVRA